MTKILVPIDGSDYSKKAMEKAKKIGDALNSEITILNVIKPMQDYKYVHNKDFYREEERLQVRESNILLEEAQKSFDDYPGEVKSLYKRGDPVDEIVKFAEEGNFDLIIMGNRGLGAFSRTLLGSISDKVIHHVKTSVLIVK